MWWFFKLRYYFLLKTNKIESSYGKIIFSKNSMSEKTLTLKLYPELLVVNHFATVSFWLHAYRYQIKWEVHNPISDECNHVCSGTPKYGKKFLQKRVNCLLKSVVFNRLEWEFREFSPSSFMLVLFSASQISGPIRQ